MTPRPTKPRTSAQLPHTNHAKRDVKQQQIICSRNAHLQPPSPGPRGPHLSAQLRVMELQRNTQATAIGCGVLRGLDLGVKISSAEEILDCFDMDRRGPPGLVMVVLWSAGIGDFVMDDAYSSLRRCFGMKGL